MDVNILTGPELPENNFNGTVAEYLFNSLKSHPKDLIIQVDASTDEKITCWNYLKKCIEFGEGLITNMGVKKGDVVTLACHNSINSFIAAVGTFFSGGIAAPIDQNSRPVEMQHLLNLLKPKYIICEKEKAQEINKNVKQINLDCKIIVLDMNVSDSNFYSINDVAIENVDVDSYVPRKVEDNKKDIFVICCSSGSTGYPKGVALSHHSLLYNVYTLKKFESLFLSKKLLFTSPLFWISNFILTIMSCVFGQTRIVPKSTNTIDYLECIQKYQPEFTVFSPSSLLFLVDHPDFDKFNLESLKLIFVGGSLLGSNLLDKIKSKWKNVHILQGYGMTEFGGGITSPKFGVTTSSVGEVLPNTLLKIVDSSSGKILGPNEIGECRVKGDRIMIGYYNNEKATKDAFDDDGWFKTGDLMYYDENKLLYVVGRIKETVKYQNYQISLAEIENFIISLPGVKDAAIVPIAHGPNHHLKAIVVKSSGSNISDNDVIEAVKNNFSEYKHLREGVEFSDSLPRTETGKLRRWQLLKSYDPNLSKTN